MCRCGKVFQNYSIAVVKLAYQGPAVIQCVNSIIIDSPMVAMVTFHNGWPHTSDISMASSETGTLEGGRERGRGGE